MPNVINNFYLRRILGLDSDYPGQAPNMSMPGYTGIPQQPAKQPERPLGGLLGGGWDDPHTQGILGAASALLQASGPSKTPVGMGQALGMGLQGYTSGRTGREELDTNQALKRVQMHHLMSGGSGPSSVQEWQYYNRLTPDDQKRYLEMKRAQQWLNLGPEYKNPVTGQSLGKGLSPENRPDVRQAQAAAAAEGKAGVEARTAPGIEYGKKVGGDTGEADVKQYDTVNSAVENITKIDELLSHLKTSDATTGMGAEFRNNVQRVINLVTESEKSGKKVSDTEILDTMMGSEVFPLIKSLGIGARGMDTPAEREFMRSVMTGQIALNKQTLIKMAEMRRNIAVRAIDRWNNRVDKGELDKFFQSSGRTREKLRYGATSGGNPSVDDLLKKYSGKP